jgi:hypothetical protein
MGTFEGDKKPEKGQGDAFWAPSPLRVKGVMLKTAKTTGKRESNFN